MNHFIIWDLDGTLMDSLTDLMNSTNYALSQCGMPTRSYDEVRQFVGNGVHKLIERAVGDNCSADDVERCFAVFKQHYMVHCKDNTKPYDGIIEVISQLHDKGCRQAIVSNKLQGGVTELHNEWFRGIIDVAIGETPGVQRKPAPDMVNKAIDGLKKMFSIDADAHITAVYIGDSDVDLATAHNAGLPCISVLWGFRSKEFLLSHGATIFAEKPQDILKVLPLG
ncbi:MAG: HAD family hydrolase [Prevotella sp.]|nr:HAD family hydrolase [Prevotella sp.]